MIQIHRKYNRANFCQELCLKSPVIHSNYTVTYVSLGGKKHSRKRPNILASTTCKEDKFYIPANQQDQCWEKFDLCEGSHSVKTKKKDAEDGGSSRIKPRFSVIQPLTRPQKNHDQGHWKTIDSSISICSNFQFLVLKI